MSTPSPRVATTPRPQHSAHNALQDVVVPTMTTSLQRINASFDPASGSDLEYRRLIRHPTYRNTWMKSAANEFGRLAQGIRNIEDINTIGFIKRNKVPNGRRVTYSRSVCDIRKQKDGHERKRLTVGGNLLIDYPGGVSSPTGSLTTYKLHVNDIISTKGARSMTMDISNFYLNSPLPRSEYMKIPITLIPDEIIDKYELQDKVDTNGFVFIEIKKGMYGLPQAGILANQLLQTRLAQHGYYPVRYTP